MARFSFPTSLLRADAESEETRVTYFELFFDLVFVYAITQVSHLVLSGPSWTHLGEAAFIAVTVWWVWIFTAWVTNWVHPDRGPVRAMLGVHMLLGLLFATAIPEAFGEKAPLFAITLVAMNVGRSVFTAVAFGPRNPAEAVNMVRISTWFAVSGVLWTAGAFLAEPERLWLWLVAFALDSVSARSFFWVPGLGPSDVAAWTVKGEHMAERVSLFAIIALGESIIVTGEGFAEHSFGTAELLAFLAAFAGTVLMWLLYFNHAQSLGSRYISAAKGSGMVAQTAYTYIPTLMMLGIVVTAVGNGLAIEHPTGETEAWTAGLLSLGSGLYLLGNLFFKKVTAGHWLWSHLAGIVAFAALDLAHPWLDAVTLSWIGDAVLLVMVFADHVQFRTIETDSGAQEPARE